MGIDDNKDLGTDENKDAGLLPEDLATPEDMAIPLPDLVTPLPDMATPENLGPDLSQAADLGDAQGAIPDLKVLINEILDESKFPKKDTFHKNIIPGDPDYGTGFYTGAFDKPPTPGVEGYFKKFLNPDGYKNSVPLKSGIDGDLMRFPDYDDFGFSKPDLKNNSKAGPEVKINFNRLPKGEGEK